MPTINIDVSGAGTLHMRTSLTPSDIDALLPYARPEGDSRELAVRMLSRIIKNADVTEESIRAWDDGILVDVVSRWAAHEAVDWKLSSALPVLQALQSAFISIWRRQRRSILKPPPGLSAIRLDAERVMPHIPLDYLAHNPAIRELARIAEENRRALQSVERASGMSIQRLTDEMTRLATENLRATDMVAKQLGAVPTRAFADALESITRVQDVMRVISLDLIESLTSTTAGTWQLISIGLQDTVRGLFDNLPDIAALQREWEERADQALEEEGLEFVTPYWNWIEKTSLTTGLDEINARVRPAALTNRLLGRVRSDRFKAAMRESFLGASAIEARWPIMEQILWSHEQRMYAVSIPALFAQVEGLFADALIVRGSVIHEEGKLYAKENGQKKRNKKGDFIQLHGLKQVIQNSDAKSSPLLAPMAQALVDSLFAERDGVLHGRTCRYCQPKRSVMLIVTAAILASMFADLESDPGGN